MAFNFYGTFSEGQALAFKYWTKYQEADLKKRISYLEALIAKNGVYTTKFDDNYNPISYTVAPAWSYAAKLIKVYKCLGGDPLKDFIIRDRNHVTYKLKGVPFDNNRTNTTSGMSEVNSDGTIERGFLFDRDVGIRQEVAKNWQLEAIKRKKEQLEFKIKRCLDYSDALVKEKEMLERMIENPLRRGMVLWANMVNKASEPGSMSLLNTTDDSIDARFAKDADPAIPTEVQQSDGERSRLPTSGNPMDSSLEVLV